MKFKLLLLISALWASMSTMFGKSQGVSDEKVPTLTYSFCYDDCSYLIGNHTKNYDVRMYIRIPVDIAKAYAGAQITGVSVGLSGYTGKTAYAFVTTDPSKGEYDTTQLLPEELLGNEDDGIAMEIMGWKLILLDNPYTITGDKDVYIGYCNEMPNEGNPWLPFLASSWGPSEDGCFYDFREHGATTYTRYTVNNNVAIKAHLTGKKLPEEYLIVTAVGTESYCKPNEEFEVWGSVMNYGYKNIEAYKIVCTLDGESAVAYNKTSTSIGTCREGDFGFTTKTEREGKRMLTVETRDAEGNPYAFTERTIASCDFANTNGGFERKILLETITNIDNPGNEITYNIIREAIEGCGEKKENVIQTNLHLGDQFANNDMKEIQWFYESKNAKFVPAVTLNRYNVPGSLTVNADGTTQEATGPLFLVDSNFSQYLQSRLNEISYISMKLTSEYSKVDNEIYIKVSGEPFIEGIAPAGAYILGVMLVEDGVLAPMEGYEGDYSHNCVPRAFLNPRGLWGDEISINGKGYATEFYYSLDGKAWKPENLRVIAFMTDYNVANVSELNKFPVVQAETCPVDPSLTSITTVNNEVDVKVTHVNGTLFIDGEFSKAIIYDLIGNQVKVINSSETNISDLPYGVYCVNVTTPERSATVKIFVQK